MNNDLILWIFSKKRLAAYLLKIVSYREDRKVSEFARRVFEQLPAVDGAPQELTIEESLHMYYLAGTGSQRYIFNESQGN